MTEALSPVLRQVQKSHNVISSSFHHKPARGKRKGNSLFLLMGSGKVWRSLLCRNIAVGIFDNYDLPRASTSCSYRSVVKSSLKTTELQQEFISKVAYVFIMLFNNIFPAFNIQVTYQNLSSELRSFLLNYFLFIHNLPLISIYVVSVDLFYEKQEI